tara:strand:- start:1375 stop:3684 length:2310 start_codon:yes stop_codon:yes gene_type:complete
MQHCKGLGSLRLALVAGYALLCASPGAQAQESTARPTDQTETIAQQSGDKSEQIANGATALKPITVIANRKAASTLDIPSNVTVIDGEEITKYGISDMQQLTRYIPGVTVERQTAATDPFNTFGGFNIRGVGGNRVLMLSDGSRVSERITDGTRDYLDFNFVKQVEVVRGPASVLWGADAMGGVVAVETIDPEDLLLGRNQGGTASLAFDSFTTSGTASASAAYRISDTLAGMVAFSRRRASEPELSNARADGGIYGCPRDTSVGQLPCNKFDDTTDDSIRGLAKLVWTPSIEHRLELSADILQKSSTVDYTVFRGPQSSGAYIDNYDRYLDRNRSRYAVTHDWTPENGFLDDLKTTVAFAPHEYKRTGTEWGTAAAGNAYKTDDILEYTEDFYEFDLQATKYFTTGPANHDLIFGFDGDYTTLDYSRIDSDTNLDTGATTETRGGGFNFANAETRRADFYLQDTISFLRDKLEITPGLRYATYKVDPDPDSDYQIVDGSEPRMREDSALLKSLGALYRINDTWSVWGKYGEGFKMPTAQQLYTSLPGSFFDLTPAPDLEPEEVASYEAGVRTQFGNGYIGVTGFYSDYTNFIQSFYNPPGTNDYTYRNLSSVEVWGIEVDGAYQMNDRVRFNGSLAWQKGDQKASDDSETVPHTLPPLTAVIGADYLIPDYDLSLSAVTTLASSVKEVSTDTGFKPGGYALLDLFGRWQMTELASLNFGVKNVFDTRYFESGAADRTTSPSTAVANQNPLELQTGPGRTFTASLNIRF